jgi:hypothetical protein
MKLKLTIYKYKEIIQAISELSTIKDVAFAYPVFEIKKQIIEIITTAQEVLTQFELTADEVNTYREYIAARLAISKEYSKKDKDDKPIQKLKNNNVYYEIDKDKVAIHNIKISELESKYFDLLKKEKDHIKKQQEVDSMEVEIEINAISKDILPKETSIKDLEDLAPIIQFQP